MPTGDIFSGMICPSCNMGEIRAAVDMDARICSNVFCRFMVTGLEMLRMNPTEFTRALGLMVLSHRANLMNKSPRQRREDMREWFKRNQ